MKKKKKRERSSSVVGGCWSRVFGSVIVFGGFIAFDPLGPTLLLDLDLLRRIFDVVVCGVVVVLDDETTSPEPPVVHLLNAPTGCNWLFKLDDHHTVWMVLFVFVLSEVEKKD